MNTLSQCLYHAQRISKLVHMWDTLRGPGMAMPPENIDQIFAAISPQKVTTHIATDKQLMPLLKRIQKSERVLLNTLTDQVYLNDDRDREIITARIALCNMLKQLRDLDPQINLANLLWQQNDGEEWSTL